jgi:hypothetical protein
LVILCCIPVYKHHTGGWPLIAIRQRSVIDRASKVSRKKNYFWNFFFFFILHDHACELYKNGCYPRLGTYTKCRSTNGQTECTDPPKDSRKLNWILFVLESKAYAAVEPIQKVKGKEKGGSKTFLLAEWHQPDLLLNSSRFEPNYIFFTAVV